MPDIVRIGGADLVRTREANGEFTYRPVDAQTGAVVDAATFEARKKAQRQAQLANDPRANERAANEWAAQTRAAIARTRVDESRRLKREDAQRRERESGTTGPRRRARELGASAKPSKALTDLREEMRIAEATGLKKKNPGSYSFLKAALDVEEGKHARAVEAARKRDYAKARSRKGVKGDAGLDAELSSGDEDNAPRIRGSLADLDDPDYRRDARPTTAKAPTPTPKGDKGERPVQTVQIARSSGARLHDGRKGSFRPRTRASSTRWRAKLSVWTSRATSRPRRRISRSPGARSMARARTTTRTTPITHEDRCEENERAWRKRRPRWTTKARGHVILFYNMDSRTQVERAFNGVVPTRVVRFASFGG